MYADTFVVKTRWEVYGLPDSDSSILRHSYKIEWVDKPRLLAGTIYKTADKKVKEAMDYFYDDFFPDSIEDYLIYKQDHLNDEEAAALGPGADPSLTPRTSPDA